jgi:colanic acid/amylovoran biosynthesis glycosyltransferase
MTKTKYKVLLFTDSYPYSSAAEDTFINPELPYLKSFFDSVIIIPKSLEGKKENISIDITVDTSLGELLKSRQIGQARIKTFLIIFTSLIFYKELLKKPKEKLQIRSILRIYYYFSVALRTKTWIIRYINDNNIDLAHTIFYTYWLKETTLGISLAKMKYPEIKIVSRAHGTDLYEERYSPPYIPFRPEIFKYLNKLFLASRDGQNYLSDKYPQYTQKFDVAILGIKNPDFITKQSDDDIFRIVTCSGLVSIKRIELLIYGIKKLGELKPDHQFSWVHIGNGPLETKLKKISETILPNNITFQFVGYLPNADVFNFYKNNSIDVFINVSQSEGGNPVSIMEAQSCGIPVIASAVGGNKEIVHEKVGILLNPDPTPEEIAMAIITCMENPELTKEKKYYSVMNFEERYNSNKNVPIFIQALNKILNGSVPK